MRLWHMSFRKPQTMTCSCWMLSLRCLDAQSACRAASCHQHRQDPVSCTCTPVSVAKAWQPCVLVNPMHAQVSQSHGGLTLQK